MLLDTVLDALFPPDVRLADAGTTRVDHYLLLPGTGEPRWLIPEAAGIGTGYLAQWQPYGRLSRLAWQGARAARQVGALGLVPGVRRIALPRAAPDGWARLGWLEAQAPLPLVHIGRPDTRRKAVAGLARATDGEVVAVTKAALVDGARDAVRHEAVMLAAIAPLIGDRAPRLLYEDAHKATFTMSAVSGHASPRGLGDAHLDFLRALRTQGATTSLAVQADRLRQRLSGQRPEPALRALDVLNDGEPLPRFIQHGDFVPWNIKIAGDGRLVVIDWEDGDTDGLPLQDFVHFIHQQAYLLDHIKGFDALTPWRGRMCDFLGSIDVDPARLHGLLVHYLLAAWISRDERGDAAHAAALMHDLEAELASGGAMA